MARGTQLIDLVTQLKAEVGASASVALGIDKTASYKQKLRRVQEHLYNDYDWPHLRVDTSKALVAGSRFYDPPTSPYSLNYERIEEVVVYYSGQPHEVKRGIGFEQYAAYDPEQNQRADPTQRWDIRWTGTKEQIEVWPLPASGDMTLRFLGIRPLRDLISDDDVTDLDDNLIVLFTAAEIMGGKKSEAAQSVLAAANSLYTTLKGRTKGGSTMATYGGGDAGRTARHETIIRVA